MTKVEKVLNGIRYHVTYRNVLPDQSPVQLLEDIIDRFNWIENAINVYFQEKYKQKMTCINCGAEMGEPTDTTTNPTTGEYNGDIYTCPKCDYCQIDDFDNSRVRPWTY